MSEPATDTGREGATRAVYLCNGAHVEGLPGRSKLKSKAKYFVIFTVNGDEVWKSDVRETKATTADWTLEKGKELALPYISTDVMQIAVCKEHPKRPVEEVGRLRVDFARLERSASDRIALGTGIEGARASTIMCKVFITQSLRPIAPEPGSPSDTGITAVVATGDDLHVGLEEDMAQTKKALENLTAPASVAQIDEVAQAVKGAGNIDTGPDVWEPLLEKVQGFVQLMDVIAEVHPYAKMAWSVLSAAYKMYKAQTARDDKVNKLAEKMTEVYEMILASDALKTLATSRDAPKVEEIQKAIVAHQELLRRLSVQTHECAHFISTYAKDPNLIKRSFTQALSSSDTIIQRFITSFEDIGKAFDSQKTLHTELMVARLLQTVQVLDTSTTLAELDYVGGAGCDSTKQCLAGTRTTILNDITNWVDSADNDAPQVRLLLGQAGTGKSTIAHTIACRFRTAGRLGSAFCFSTAASDRCWRFLPTMARNLADFDPAFGAALRHELRIRPHDDRKTMDIARQCEVFITNPSINLSVIGSVLVLIDGLDEMGDARTRTPVLSILFRQLRKMPRGFRILLTSRPEQDILSLFQVDNPVPQAAVWDLATSDTEGLRQDIGLFIRTELSKPELGVRKLDDSCHTNLITRSEGLFQWARVACDYIVGDGRGAGNAEERYEALLDPQNESVKKEGVLDALYKLVLPRLLRLDTEQARLRFKTVMGMVVHAFEPLTMDALRSLSNHVVGIKPSDVDDVVPFLGTFLSGVSAATAPIRPLHSSFRDFLAEDKRSSDFHVGIASLHHANLSISCLHILSTGKNLDFNMCQIKTSYRLNQDISDLQQRVCSRIPSWLAYSCRYWGQHLGYARYDSMATVLQDLNVLLQAKCLYWLEALSLLGAVNHALEGLVLAVRKLATLDQYLFSLASDCLRFVRTMAIPISESAPHVYLSAMMNAPECSLMSTIYEKKLQYCPRICTGRPQQWPQDNVLNGHQSHVNSVAFTHDGRHVVSGSWDCTVRIWNAHTSQQAGEPLLGHRGWVRSVAVSNASLRIVSGSEDKTVRIWDLESRTPVGDSLLAHSGTVWSVSLSPDGKRVASGSEDHTIRIWDALTGLPIGGPLEGHTGSVQSVCFSHDGTQLVSGSHDNTLRIWDVETRTPNGGPFGEDVVYRFQSVSFSHDSRRIVTGSWGGRIHVWDVASRTPLDLPFRGHTRIIRSVAFSHDSRWIVSGAEDDTVRLWNAETGEQEGPPLIGHKSFVLSVAFAPDSTRVVSGSSDCTGRTWDLALRYPEPRALPQATIHDHLEQADRKQYPRLELAKGISPPPPSTTPQGKETSRTAHRNGISCLAFVHEDKHIISSPTGQNDRKIRTWDTHAGQLLAEPIDCIVAGVRSLAISHDEAWLAAGGREFVGLWDLQTGKTRTELLQDPRTWSWSVSLSPDNTRLVSASQDVGARVWDTTTGVSVGDLKGTDWRISHATYTRDGSQILVGGWSGHLQAWDAQTREAIEPPFIGHTAEITSVTTSPNGKHVVSASIDRTIRVWDAVSHEAECPPLTDHTHSVRCVSFSPDGNWLVSSSDDGTIRVWDAKTLRLARLLPTLHQGSVNTVSFSQDGQLIASGGDDMVIRIWKLNGGNTRAFCSDPAHHLAPREDTSEGQSLHISASPTAAGGWIRYHDDALLWLAPDVLSRLRMPPCEQVIPNEAMVCLDLSDFAHGERWTECWCP